MAHEQQGGFTLLEVILALAILAGSMAALGEVMRLANQSATMTEGETQAQILAASLIDEFASGARQLAAADHTPLDSSTQPPWVYSVAIENTNYQELVAIRVLVEQQVEPALQPARYELVRWIANPNYTPPEETEQSSTSAGSSSSSSTSAAGTGASSGSSGTGGQR